MADELVNDCSSILACLPQLNVIQVLTALSKYSSVERDQRVKITLQHLFNEQDTLDTPADQQKDVELIQNLIPGVTKSRISSLMPYIGNEENRKAILLRLLLKESKIERINGKRRLNGLVQDENQPSKISKVDGSSHLQTEASTNVTKPCNDNTNRIVPNVYTCDSSVSNTTTYVCDESLVSNTVVHFEDEPSSSTKEVTEIVKAKPKNYFEYKISQPSTSRAVWNEITESYEEAVSTHSLSDLIEVISADSTSNDPNTNLGNTVQTGKAEFVYSNVECPNVNLEEVVDNFIYNLENNEEEPTEVSSFDETLLVSNAEEEQNENSDVVYNTSKASMEPVFHIDITSNTTEETVENKLFYPLMEMFPQACPDYLKAICADKAFSEDLLNELTTKLLSEDYPRRDARSKTPEGKLDPDEQFEILKQVLPDADPTYLRLKCDELSDKPELLKQFISEAIEYKSYPTMKAYLREQQLSAQQKQYTVDFQVSKFLEVIPDPVTYFEKERYAPITDSFDLHYACGFLRNEFLTIPVNMIGSVTRKASSLIKAYEELENSLKNGALTPLKTKRKPRNFPDTCKNIPLLQEMAYLKHKQEILNYMKEQKLREEEERENAKKNGLLQTCNCCFDDEVLDKDTTRCENGCIFCKQCVQKSVEVAFGDGKLEFNCLANCPSYFGLQTIQSAVNPKLFSKVAQKKQMEEVKAAGIEDLEMCPFCDFATIPAENDKLFRCLNPECMKESCRLCKEPSHIPLKCDEVERDEDVKRRTYIENKMSEALLKKCYKCGKCFIKSDGCNKITCTCGARQCYLCGSPVNGYEHFNGQGGDNHHLCPLYSDTEALHEAAVLNGAETAKAEIGVDPKELKIDPTSDIKQHYSRLKKRIVPHVQPAIFGFLNERQPLVYRLPPPPPIPYHHYDHYFHHPNVVPRPPRRRRHRHHHHHHHHPVPAEFQEFPQQN